MLEVALIYSAESELFLLHGAATVEPSSLEVICRTDKYPHASRSYTLANC